MAFTGPNVPHRTPRKIALEKGVDLKGLTSGDEGYNTMAGVPETVVGGKSMYNDRAAREAQPTEQAAQPRPTKNQTKVG
jgi:hypothetical protein